MSTIIQKPQRMAFDVYANNPFSFILQFSWGRVPSDLSITVYAGLGQTAMPALVPTMTLLPQTDQVLVSWSQQQVQVIRNYNSLVLEVHYNNMVQGSGPLRATYSTVTGVQTPFFHFKTLAGEDILVIVDDLITLLGDRLTAAETALETLDETVDQVTAVKHAVDTTKGQIDTIKTAIDGQKSAVDTAKQAVDTTKGQIDTIKTAIDGQKSAVDTAKQAVDTTKGQIDTIKTAIDGQKSAVDTAREAVDTTKGQIDTIKTAIDGQKSAVDTAKQAVDTTKSQIDTIKNQVDQAATNSITSNTAAIGGALQVVGPATPTTGGNVSSSTLYFHNLAAAAESVLSAIQVYVAATGNIKFKVLGVNTDGTLYTVQDINYTAGSTGLKTLVAGTDFPANITVPTGGYIGIYIATGDTARVPYGGAGLSFYNAGEDFTGSGAPKGSLLSIGQLQYNYTLTSKALATRIVEGNTALSGKISANTDAGLQVVGQAFIRKGSGGTILHGNTYMPAITSDAGKVTKVVVNASTAGTVKLKTLSVNPDDTLALYNEVTVTIAVAGLVTLVDGTDFSEFYMPQGGYLGVFLPVTGGADIPYTTSGGAGLYQLSSSDYQGTSISKGSILAGFYTHIQATITLGTVNKRIGDLNAALSVAVKRDVYDNAEGKLSVNGLVVSYTGSRLYSRGVLTGLLTGSITVSATGVSTNKRVDVLQIDPATRTVSVVQGTERNSIDATEDAYRAKPTGGNFLLGYIVVVNTTVTAIGAGTYEGVFRRGYEAEILRCIHLGRAALIKSTRKLLRGLTLTIAGYGDSITAIQSGAVAFTANGSGRDRVEYLSGWASDALPVTYDTGDGAGQTHIRIGWNWILKTFLEKKYGGVVNYNNYGISGTTSANTTNNGLWPARIAQIVADVPDTCILAFGMNEIGSIATYANMVSIIQQLQAVGTECIVMACPRPQSGASDNWRYTNAQLKRAAIDTGSAFVPLNYYATDLEYFWCRLG